MSATVTTYTPEQVKQMYERNEIVLIDVRTPNEYAHERIPGALNAPLSSLDPAKLPSQQGKPIVFHCGSGKRSEIASRACLDAGFETIAHMSGGFGAWKQAGYPVLVTNAATGNLERQG